MRRLKGRFKKGQTWQVEEMLKLFLVIIVFGGAVLLIIGATGGLTGVLEDFCKKNPSWCGEAKPDDYAVARASVSALVDAINCVADPSTCRCTGTIGCIFNPEKYGSSITAAVVESPELSGDSKVSAQAEDPLNAVPDISSSNPASLDFDEIKLRCTKSQPVIIDPQKKILTEPKAGYFGCVDHKTYESGTLGLRYFRDFECKYCDEGFIRTDNTNNSKCKLEEPVVCSLTNFQLPQDTSNAEEWIKGYGDPNFLVYWQEFPQGEDAAWSGKLSWFENVYDIVFAWWGTGKVFQFGGTLGKETIRYAVKKGGYSAMKYSEKIAFPRAFEFVEKYGEAGVKETLVELGQVVKPKIKASDLVDIGRRLSLRGVTVGSLAYGLYYLDSMSRKYDQYTDSIIFKIPYDDPENKPIKIDKPIFLRYQRGIDKETQFYLASPCSANLKIERVVATCEKDDDQNNLAGGYAYDIHSGAMKCMNPTLEYFGNIRKGEITCRKDNNIAAYYPDKSPVVPDIVSGLGSTNKEELRIYDHDDSWKTVTIRDPIDRVSFVVEKIQDNVNLGLEMVQDGMMDIWKIKKIIFEGTSEGDKAFDVNDDGKIITPEFEVEIHGDAKFDSDPYLINIKIEPDGFDVIKSTCYECNNFTQTFRNIDSISFEQENREFETDKGTENIRNYQLIIIHKDFSVAFIDKGTKIIENSEESATPDGIAETIGIEDQSVWEDFFNLYSYPDQIILNDMDYDGKMDIISTNLDCKIQGVSVEVTEKNNIDASNFCFADEGIARRVIRWAPEAGIVLGGLAGLFGGPFAEVTVSGGAVVGQRIGATIFTAYLINEKVSGSAAIWPGEKI